MSLPPPTPIPTSYTPKASITHLPTASDISTIFSTLDRDGGLILTDFISQDQLSQLNNDVATCRKAQESDGKIHTGIPSIPTETILVNGLVGKSTTAASICTTHPVVTALLDQILTDRFVVTREGLRDKHIIPPLLHTSLSFNVGPGAPRQRLHRDDAVHGIRHPEGGRRLEDVSQIAVMIAGTETTRENGATMFIPGSHRWGDERDPTVEEVCFAEMPPKSALLFLGSAFHGAGHNSTDHHRVVHGLFFCRGTLRTEENQFLAIPKSVVLDDEKVDDKMRSLLGYARPSTTLGVVDGRDPMGELRVVLDGVGA